MKKVFAIIVVFLLGLYHHELKDLYYSLVDNQVDAAPILNPDGSVVIRSHDGTHFFHNFTVNGKEVRFLVDTGASHLTLTQQDAAAVGIDVNSLQYNLRTSTANGFTYSAFVLLSEVSIGGIVLNNVKASVSRDKLGISLMGMSFLSRLSSFTIAKGMMTLRQ